MRQQRRASARKTCLTLMGIVAILTIQGSQAQGIMADSSGAQELVWQGAADRQPAKFLGIRVTEIRKAGSGLFGLRNSPSMPGYQPDPHIVAGTRLRGEGSLPVQARLPGGEVPAGLAPGGRAVLGLVDDEHIICILLPPASVPDTGLADWANGQTCG